ncbi:SWF or SNF family helicase [Streptomyces sp. A7024]|uniref:SWF or SNF family helicase n=1 Tax=Streptomyces coryli TaxID=1128680 RepID=A0A6G4U894_9ACTN|nr:SWF or SNF family helicase [Streptomyces coryli]NGN67517.1 SWF or SNF family helicase [Streptomyces coryli]
MTADEIVFEALPPASGRGFAQTWWGQAWLKALEASVLDSRLLLKGRKLARAGAVGAVSVRPGRLTSVVQTRDRTEHRADVLVQRLTDADWDRLLDVIADRAGHIAALLDRDMPPQLVEDAAAAGVDLLPGIGDLQPECGCDEWEDCEHTAALSYQVARLLDRDPFILLLMRGRGERDLLAELQSRSAMRASAPAGSAVEEESAGVRVAEAFAAPVPELPAPPPVVREPGAMPVLSADTDPAPGVEVAALEFLVADTAGRAQRWLAAALSPGHAESAVPVELTEGEDAVRLAAGGADIRITARLAKGSTRDRGAMDRAVRAWGYGGAAALDVLESEWTPDAASLARARDQLATAWPDETAPPARATRNRWTLTGTNMQLRYGRDGRWWPYRKERGAWWPAGPADRDPAGALGALGALRDELGTTGADPADQ